MLNGLMMDYPLTLDVILEHAKRMTPQKTIKTQLPDGSWHEYTYADFYRRVKRLGNVLETLGIEAGDRVATFAWNSFEHLELYFGIPGAGAVCHTLNIRLSHEQLKTIIDHAEDKVIFIDGTLLPLDRADRRAIKYCQALCALQLRQEPFAKPAKRLTLRRPDGGSERRL